MRSFSGMLMGVFCVVFAACAVGAGFADKDNLAVVFGIALIANMIIGALISRYYEKKDWNGGFCSEGGSAWENFDTDSQGGRGYKCSCCSPRRCIWISYGIDKRRTNAPSAVSLSC